MVRTDIIRKFFQKLKSVMFNFYSRYFSEVGFVTKRFNFTLNLFFNVILIAKDVKVSRIFISRFRRSRVQDLNILNQKLDQLKDVTILDLELLLVLDFF
jgi:hypothetical protein